ncbi:MAG: transposase [Candidatus Cybelea sp.]
MRRTEIGRCAKSRFSEAQIVAILREFDAGTPADEFARRHGIHANTIRLWRSKDADITASDLARLEQLALSRTVEFDQARERFVIRRLPPRLRTHLEKALECELMNLLCPAFWPTRHVKRSYHSKKSTHVHEFAWFNKTRQSSGRTRDMCGVQRWPVLSAAALGAWRRKRADLKQASLAGTT